MTTDKYDKMTITITNKGDKITKLIKGELDGMVYLFFLLTELHHSLHKITTTEELKP